MSAPCSSMWVAHECRSTCGESRPSSPTRSPAPVTIDHAALPREPAAPRVQQQGVARDPACRGPLQHRPPLAEVARGSRCRALRPIGTTRSFDPLPSTRTSPSSRSRSARSSPTNSLIRTPVAYNVSRMARSRSARGSSPSTAPRSAFTSSSVSAFGSPCGTRGAPTSSLGSTVDEALVDTEPVKGPDCDQRARDRRRARSGGCRRRRAPASR